jgi:hypothetical protein
MKAKNKCGRCKERKEASKNYYISALKLWTVSMNEYN